MGNVITLESNGKFDAYVADPAEGVAFKGGLIVIHEIWGLVDHIKDVADRFAAEGYLVLAPDLFARVGIDAHLGEELMAIMTSPDEKVRTEGQPKLREALGPVRAPEFAEWAVPALITCVDYLESQPGVDGRVAVTGFCFGGSYSFALAAADPRIRAAVPFYGSPAADADLERVACPILAFYGATDENLMASLPTVKQAMDAAGVDFTAKVYEGAGHAFFNDTNAHAYNPEVAADAWGRALAFLDASPR